MMISTKGRYALRVMIDLAQHENGEFIPMKDVAARQGISLKYLEQILPLLTKNKLVDTMSGKGGGYRLNRAPKEYSVWEILKHTEGGMAPVACLEEGAEACPREAGCATIGLWKGLDDVVKEYLRGKTLEEFL